jgi:ribosomal protein L14
LTDTNKRVVFDIKSIPSLEDPSVLSTAKIGDFVIVKIKEGYPNTLIGDAISHSSIKHFDTLYPKKPWF